MNDLHLSVDEKNLVERVLVDVAAYARYDSSKVDELRQAIHDNRELADGEITALADSLGDVLLRSPEEHRRPLAELTRKVFQVCLERGGLISAENFEHVVQHYGL